MIMKLTIREEHVSKAILSNHLSSNPKKRSFVLICKTIDKEAMDLVEDRRKNGYKITVKAEKIGD